MHILPNTVIPGQLIAPEFDILEKKTKNDSEGDIDVSTEEKPTIIKYLCGTGTKLIDHTLANGDTVNVITSTKIGDVYSFNIESPSDYVSHDEGRKVQFMTISVGNSDLIKRNGGNVSVNSNLPREGDLVLCRVNRISLQRANVEILAVGNKNIPIDSGVGTNGSGIVAVGGGSGGLTFSVSQASSDLGETFKGIIRSQDVRATDRDKVVVINCFKPGDIVKAQVLSLGDGNNYYLTTARNDLGVVFAKANNGAGGLMYATDWQTMTSPTTGVTEKRKCAKPF